MNKKSAERFNLTQALIAGEIAKGASGVCSKSDIVLYIMRDSLNKLEKQELCYYQKL